MKYYIIAGEASGDLHGSNLIRALLEKDENAIVRFWGGDKMAAEGGTLVKHYKELAFMGFWEVFVNLKTILKNIRFCKKDILTFNPDVMIYIDYPGFNMRIAEWAKLKGFKNHYYISPQIWAWKENRIKKIKRDLEALYVILPFEQNYFQEKHQHKVTFVGHPLIPVVKKELASEANELPQVLNTSKKIVALLPGSRKQEIKKMMPLFLSVIKDFPKQQFIIAGAPGISPSWYQQFAINPAVSILHNQTHTLLKHAHVAIVTSGTATLETALFKVPQMVCYRSSRLSYAIAKRIIKLEHISLVNLIMNKTVVKELIQDKCTPETISKELHQLLLSKNRSKIEQEYHQLEKILGHQNASQQVAHLIYQAIV